MGSSFLASSYALRTLENSLVVVSPPLCKERVAMEYVEAQVSFILKLSSISLLHPSILITSFFFYFFLVLHNFLILLLNLIINLLFFLLVKITFPFSTWSLWTFEDPSSKSSLGARTGVEYEVPDLKKIALQVWSFRLELGVCSDAGWVDRLGWGEMRIAMVKVD